MADMTITPNAGKARRASLIAAIFLMATSAIGPGFITQTATFTAKLGATFAFAILISILVDIAVQLNIWRILVVTRRKAAQLANEALPGTGYLIAILVMVGGLVFNVGNIAGAGQGLEIMLGIDSKLGALISALIAILIFSSKRAGMAVDKLIVFLGVLMIAMTVYVAFQSNPPLGLALKESVFPSHIDADVWTSITTIVGGTVGGYITYAGAHRLLDKGVSGVEHLAEVSSGAVKGIILTGIMRFVLFLAILGVVATGTVILGQDDNPAAIAFRTAAGGLGYRLFGLVFWCAALTSIIGAAYTSMSFIDAFKKNVSERAVSLTTVVFIAVSLAVFITLGKAPQQVLVFAGGFNGLILPIGFSIFMLVGWLRSDLMEGYRYPRWLLLVGTATCLLTWYMGFKSLDGVFKLIGIEL